MDNAAFLSEQIQTLPAWPPQDQSEPCTMPLHWDMSEIMALNKTTRDETQAAAEANTEQLPGETAAPVEHPAMRHDPFPEPRTVPSQWVIE
jgi:hypothetical protein